MLLIAFACLPPSTRAHVAADLRQQVCAHAATSTDRPVADWVALLVTLNPVLRWHPATGSLLLAEEGWAQLLQFTRPCLRPVPARQARAAAW